MRSLSTTGRSPERKTMINIVEKTLSLIPKGKINAISLSRLATLTGQTNRTVKQIVLKARESGEPICSSQYGYYMPSTLEEAIEYYEAQMKRVSTSYGVLRTMKKYIEREGSREQWEELEHIACYYGMKV